ncbi:GTPase Era [Fundidesulfovibrio magnetotacticus]|uniref:GTPase Era n=1 Tax=Fundidesulfovibrio magnetotacticus TaxID=2730080 RepID=A0A6V8LWK5_9BACT|nr:GTPase Era [Fundidesulfovibrio magnetotacticus]GFK95280.1 GTPase Era [Fundidesulfovibrio magnetotacticus]
MSTSPHRFGHIALLGPPNAGKSTLLNALLGQKLAIVSPKPQTTRNQLAGILTLGDAQIVLIDTPGVHVPRGSRLNSRIVEAAWQALAQAQAIVLVLDCPFYLQKPDLLEKDIKLLSRPVERSGLPVIVALNKLDALADVKNMLPVMARLGEAWPGAEIVPVSALKEKGLDQLLSVMTAHLPEGDSLYPEDELTTAPMRFLASEIIREKLFLALSQELPYNTAVAIEHWQDTPKGARVNAVIYVSRDRHKGMVIGKGGKVLKDVGSKARQDLIELMGGPVHLELFVKVREGWTEDEFFLNELGEEQGS